MSYSVKWIVENKINPLIYLSTTQFWECQINNEDILTQHLNLNKKFVLEKGSFLAKDGESIVHYRVFSSEKSFNEWLELKDKLPILDKELTWTRITEIDPEKYILNRFRDRFMGKLSHILHKKDY